MHKIAAIVLSALFPICTQLASAQGIAEGRATYQGRCIACHGDGGAGGELGPTITPRISRLDDAQLAAVILNGKLDSGMPAFVLGDVELRNLVTYLRTLRDDRYRRTLERVTVNLTGGGSLSGEVIGQSLRELQLLTVDG